MRVIGTAGHVDHGKSTLVQAITGIHPDRLKEEREREMTIDLGFAWFTLPDDEEVGIVDVPGHRDFIENMLAGVGGIDAALFVVAADEGVMPQTREHLAILDLLQVQGGVVVLTKIDLVVDEDWLDLVEADLRQVLAGTVLENAPILRVSARTGKGISQLLLVLSEILAERPPRLAARAEPRQSARPPGTADGFLRPLNWHADRSSALRPSVYPLQLSNDGLPGVLVGQTPGRLAHAPVLVGVTGHTQQRLAQRQAVPRRHEHAVLAMED